jgi:hypothetical protein
VQVIVADLPRAVLGLASPATNTIWLDANAAGAGWVFDSRTASQTATGRFDLLTVVAHELGHLLGHGDLDFASHPDHLMTGRLGPGTSRLPELTPASREAATHASHDALFALAPLSSRWGDTASSLQAGPAGLGTFPPSLEAADYQSPWSLASRTKNSGLRLDEASVLEGELTSRSAARKALGERLESRDREAIVDRIFSRIDDDAQMDGKSTDGERGEAG